MKGLAEVLATLREGPRVDALELARYWPGACAVALQDPASEADALLGAVLSGRLLEDIEEDGTFAWAWAWASNAAAWRRAPAPTRGDATARAEGLWWAAQAWPLALQQPTELRDALKAAGESDPPDVTSEVLGALGVSPPASAVLGAMAADLAGPPGDPASLVDQLVKSEAGLAEAWPLWRHLVGAPPVPEPAVRAQAVVVQGEDGLVVDLCAARHRLLGAGNWCVADPLIAGTFLIEEDAPALLDAISEAWAWATARQEPGYLVAWWLALRGNGGRQLRIGGPSIGLAAAVAFAALVEPDLVSPEPSVAYTGRVRSDGTVDTVGHLELKADLASRLGIDTLIGPPGTDAQKPNVRVLGVRNAEAALSATLDIARQRELAEAQALATEPTKRRWLWMQHHVPAQEYVARIEFRGRIRDTFLNRVWSQRIVNGLERSLQQAVEVHLGLRNAPELLKFSYAQSTAEPGEILSVSEAYEQAGGQLLLVGPPGSGKTTQALKLMRHLLVKARNDERAPVPEIFPLAWWAKERKPLTDWLADLCQLRHGWDSRNWRSLIEHGLLLPVLDGLDEVAPEHRSQCVREVNRFWERRGGPLVVCSRLVEYEELSERLKLGGAVTICAPAAEQVDRYLAAAGPHWVRVRAQLRAPSGNTALSELLATPLMLNVALVAYRSDDPDELCATDHADGQRERLWSRFVSAMSTRSYDPLAQVLPEVDHPYTEAQVRRWLGWLASDMQSRNETELWLHERTGQPGFRVKAKVVAGLLVGLIAFLIDREGPAPWLLAGLIPAVLAGLIPAVLIAAALTPVPAYREKLDVRRLLMGPVLGMLFGLSASMAGSRAISSLWNLGLWLSERGQVLAGLPAGLLAGLLFGGLFRLTGRATFDPLPAPDKKLEYRRSLAGLGFVLTVGLLAGLVGGLVGAVFPGALFAWDSLHQPLDSALVVGLMGGLLVGMPPRLKQRSVVSRTSTGPVNSTGEMALLGGLFIGMIGYLPLGLAFGLALGIPIGLVNLGQQRRRVAPRSPTELVKNSAKVGLFVGLLPGPLPGLLLVALTGPSSELHRSLLDWVSVPLLSELVLGLPLALAFGLGCLVLHYSSRLPLRGRGVAPLRWVRFLDWATARLLLRSTGASYEWSHLELRNYLARQDTSVSIDASTMATGGMARSDARGQAGRNQVFRRVRSKSRGRSRRRWVLGPALLGVLVSGLTIGQALTPIQEIPFTQNCGRGGDAAGGSSGTLTGQRLVVAASWTGTEKDEFLKVLEHFKKSTGAGVILAYANSSRDLAHDFEARIKNHCPPDVAILPQPGLLQDLASRNVLRPIDDVAGALVTKNYSPIWRDLGSFQNRLYGVWFRAATKSTIWYRPEVFQQAKVDPPRTWDELKQVATAIEASGTTPFSVAGGPGAAWTLTDWFENVYLATAGPDLYDKLAKHQIPWTDPSVKQALATLAEIFGKPAWLAGGTQGARAKTYPGSVGDVFGASPNAAMVFEGNFVANTIPDVTKSAVPKAATFDFPAIGGSNPLIVGGDAAVLFTNNQAGKALIKYLATPQAAEDWASAGGFISPNKNLNLSIYPRGATQDAARKLIQAKTCYFGLSDLQPPAFGATEGKGMWKIFQEFLANPEAVDTIAGALEAEAKNEWGKTRRAPLTASGEPCG